MTTNQAAPHHFEIRFRPQQASKTVLKWIRFYNPANTWTDDVIRAVDALKAEYPQVHIEQVYDVYKRAQEYPVTSAGA